MHASRPTFATLSQISSTCQAQSVSRCRAARWQVSGGGREGFPLLVCEPNLRRMVPGVRTLLLYRRPASKPERNSSLGAVEDGHSRVTCYPISCVHRFCLYAAKGPVVDLFWRREMPCEVAGVAGLHEQSEPHLVG